MHFIFADPPYIGMAKRYTDPITGMPDEEICHSALINKLHIESDGWALCSHTRGLFTILPLCPPGTRVAAWVKPMAMFKPNIQPAYAWEPVIFCGGRKNKAARESGLPTPRDWYSENIARTGFFGSKPAGFCRWVLSLLGWLPGDTVDDIFPGTGIMGHVVACDSGQPQQGSLL